MEAIHTTGVPTQEVPNETMAGFYIGQKVYYILGGMIRNANVVRVDGTLDRDGKSYLVKLDVPKSRAISSKKVYATLEEAKAEAVKSLVVVD